MLHGHKLLTCRRRPIAEWHKGCFYTWQEKDKMKTKKEVGNGKNLKVKTALRAGTPSIPIPPPLGRR